MEKNSPLLLISWSSLWRLAAFALLVWLVFVSKDVIVAALLGLVLSAGLNIIVDYLEQKKLPRALSVVLVLLLIILLLALAIVFFIKKHLF